MLKALFFDFNGVLVDDESIHFRTFQNVLREEGIRLTEAEYMTHYLARDDKGCFKKAFKDAGKSLGLEQLTGLIGRKSAYYDAAIESGFTIFEGAQDFVRASARKYAAGLVSGALRREINQVLNKIGLLECFKVIVSAEDVQRSKPDPECYILGLERLNQKLNGQPPIRANECIVIEDSVGGAVSAKAAGMRCVAALNTYPKNAFKDVDLCVDSLASLTLERLEKLF